MRYLMYNPQTCHHVNSNGQCLCQASFSTDNEPVYIDEPKLGMELCKTCKTLWPLTLAMKRCKREHCTEKPLLEFRKCRDWRIVKAGGNPGFYNNKFTDICFECQKSEKIKKTGSRITPKRQAQINRWIVGLVRGE